MILFIFYSLIHHLCKKFQLNILNYLIILTLFRDGFTKDALEFWERLAEKYHGNKDFVRTIVMSRVDCLMEENVCKENKVKKLPE